MNVIDIAAAIYALIGHIKDLPKSRSNSLAATKLEEGALWLCNGASEEDK